MIFRVSEVELKSAVMFPNVVGAYRGSSLLFSCVKYVNAARKWKRNNKDIIYR
jgi:hypothetical protein